MVDSLVLLGKHDSNGLSRACLGICRDWLCNDSPGHTFKITFSGPGFQVEPETGFAAQAQKP